MKILVTGGAGFIGSHLIDRLLLKGEHVSCIDNLLLGNRNYLEEATNYKHFKFYEFDILDNDRLNAIFKKEKFDFVYHLAANSDIQAGFNDSNIDYKNTFLTTFNIINNMKKYNVKNIVFASSSAIYGDHNASLNEDFGPLIPISNYGAAKLSSEAYISSFCNCYDLNAWIIRFPNVVGWRLTHGVIFDFMNKLEHNPKELTILGNGRQTKPYLYINDLLDAFEKVISFSDKNKKNIQYYNVSSNSTSNVDFIADTIINHFKYNLVKRYTGGEIGWVGDVPNFSYDTTKIEKIGWIPKYSSDQAIIESIKKEYEFRHL